LFRLRREPSSSTLGKVEVQGVQQFHGGVRRVHGDIARHVEQAFRVVEDDPHDRVDRSLATFCAAPAGTASTPTTMFLSRTTSFPNPLARSEGLSKQAP